MLWLGRTCHIWHRQNLTSRSSSHFIRAWQRLAATFLRLHTVCQAPLRVVTTEHQAIRTPVIIFSVKVTRHYLSHLKYSPPLPMPQQQQNSVTHFSYTKQALSSKVPHQSSSWQSSWSDSEDVEEQTRSPNNNTERFIFNTSVRINTELYFTMFLILANLSWDNYSQCVCRLVCRHARKQAHKAQDYSKTF